MRRCEIRRGPSSRQTVGSFYHKMRLSEMATGTSPELTISQDIRVTPSTFLWLFYVHYSPVTANRTTARHALSKSPWRIPPSGSVVNP